MEIGTDMDLRIWELGFGLDFRVWPCIWIHLFCFTIVIHFKTIKYKEYDKENNK